MPLSFFDFKAKHLRFMPNRMQEHEKKLCWKMNNPSFYINHINHLADN